MLTPSFAEFRSDRAARWQRLAIFLWIAVLAGSCGRCLVGRAHRDVGIFSVYAEAGRHWFAGTDLYPPKDAWDSFLYSPLVAALLVPYSVLPPLLGNVLWRLTLGGVYLLALRWWSRAVLPPSLTRMQEALIYLLVLPVTVMTLLDGQAGGLVAAALLLTIAAAADERWGYAAAFATLGCLLKVYPIALVLLLAVAYPRRAVLPALAALLAGLALPFLFQRPGYVADQYAKWFTMMAASDRQGWNLDIANRDVAILFRAWIAPLDRHVWLAIQLGSAAGAAALCAAARRAGWSRPTLLLMLQGLAACWMTLFGPVVESFTYILVGPTLAWLLVEAWQLRRPWPYRGVLAASWAIFASATLAVVVMHSIKYHRLGPHPLAGLLLLSAILAETARRFRERSVVAPAKKNLRRAARESMAASAARSA
jgi:glycosyl transferase family 87